MSAVSMMPLDVIQRPLLEGLSINSKRNSKK